MTGEGPSNPDNPRTPEPGIQNPRPQQTPTQWGDIFASEAEQSVARSRRRSRRREPSRFTLQDLREQARAYWAEPRRDNTTGTSILSTKDIDLQHARAVVDLAGRIAAAALGAGATAADSTAMLLRVTQHFKVSVHADVTMSSVTITHFRSLERSPITILRRVREKVTDYRRLEMVEELVDEITADRVALAEARRRIGDIVRMPKTFRRWVQTASKGALGFFVAMLFGGDLAECLLAGLTTAGVDLILLGVSRIKAPDFFGQVAGSAFTGAIALLVMSARANTSWNVTISPSLIVAAGMVSMLAGLSMTTAARDAIDGYYVTSAARFVEVGTLTGGIVLGLTATLWAGIGLGVPAYLAPSTGARPVWILQLIAAALIALSYAVNTHVTPRSWLLAAFFGVLTWAVSSLVGTRVVLHPGMVFLAAFAAGLIGQALNRVARVPTTALVTAGVVSLVPGMALYRGLLSLVQVNQGQAITESPTTTLFNAVITAVMIAAGASLGTTAGRPLSMPQDWATRLALSKAWGRGHTARD